MRGRPFQAHWLWRGEENMNRTDALRCIISSRPTWEDLLTSYIKDSTVYTIKRLTVYLCNRPNYLTRGMGWEREIGKYVILTSPSRGSNDLVYYPGKTVNCCFIIYFKILGILHHEIMTETF